MDSGSIWDNVRGLSSGLVDAAKDVLQEEDPTRPDDELAEVLAENEQLARVCEKQKADLSLAHTELHSIKSMFRQAELERDRYESELKSVRKELEAHSTAKRDDLDETESRLLEKYAADMEKKTMEIERLRELLSAEKSKPEAASGPSEQDLEELRMELESLSKQLTEEREFMEKQREAETAELGALRQANELMEKKVAELRDSEKIVRAQKDALEQKLKQAPAQHEVDALRRQLESLTTQLSVERNDSGQAENEELAGLRQANELMEQKVADLLESLQAAQGKCESLEAQMQSATSPQDVENLRIQVQSLSAQLLEERESTGTERQAEIAELTKLRDTNELMEAKVAQLAESEAAARQKSELLKSHLLEREEELESLATHIAANKEFIESLQAELQQAREDSERVAELERLLEDKEKQVARAEKALANLDEAVGLMTEDHRVEMGRKERLLKEKFADELAAKLKARDEEHEGMTSALKAQVEARELEMNRLRVQLAEQDKKEDALMKEVGPLREALNEAVRKLTDAVDKDQYSVDKRLVSNLVFSYFCNNGGKKNEILCLLLRILDVPKANRERIYEANSGGWFGKRYSEEDEEAAQPSIGDMWVEFLLKEAQATEEEEMRKEEAEKRVKSLEMKALGTSEPSAAIAEGGNSNNGDANGNKKNNNSSNHSDSNQ